jgi:GGDEF domain-containing protein
MHSNGPTGPWRRLNHLQSIQGGIHAGGTKIRERLAVLRSFEILDMQQTESLDTICRIAAAIMDTPIALLSISDADKQVFKGRCGFEGKELARELAPCAYAILGRRPLVVDDLTSDDRFADNPVVMDAPHLRFYAGAPLLTSDNFALGTLCAIDVKPRHLTDSQIATLVDLSKTAMTLFEYHRSLGRLRDEAATDPASGALNRTALLMAIEKSIRKQREQGYPFAIACFDFSSDAPDLAGAAELLTETMPGHYAVGRIGAKRMAVLCVGADADIAMASINRGRIALKDEQVRSALTIFSDAKGDAADCLAMAEGSLSTA